MPRRELTEVEVMRVITLIENGCSQRQIARDMGVSQSVISRILSRYRQTGRLCRRRGQGRKRETTEREDRNMVRHVLRERMTTAKDVSHNVTNCKLQRAISDQTAIGK